MGDVVAVETPRVVLVEPEPAAGTLVVGPPQGAPGPTGPTGPQQFYLGGAQPAPAAVPILWLKDSAAPNAQPGDYDVKIIP